MVYLLWYTYTYYFCLPITYIFTFYASLGYHIKTKEQVTNTHTYKYTV